MCCGRPLLLFQMCVMVSQRLDNISYGFCIGSEKQVTAEIWLNITFVEALEITNPNQFCF